MTCATKTKVLLTSLLVLLPHLGLAKERLSVKLACARINKGISVLAYMSAKTKKFETVQLNVNHLSAGILVSPNKNGKIQFYDPSKLPSKSQPAPAIVSLLANPQAKEQLALLLPAAQTDSLIYQAKSLPMTKDFKYGSSCIINLTKNEIYLRKNNAKDKPSKIVTGRSHIVDSFGSDAQLKIEFASPHSTSKRITRFYSATWALHSNTRELCLIYQKPGKKWPSTKVISESKAVSLN